MYNKKLKNYTKKIQTTTGLIDEWNHTW
jgi:hypothetical protein